MKANKIKKELKLISNKNKAETLQRFFKTGKGQYGEGDKFLGVMVPKQREIVKKYFKEIDLKEIKKLLFSVYHEERLVALLLLVKKFEKGDSLEKKEIYNFYLKNTKQINNWDLVDLTAPNIVGVYSFKNDKRIVYKLIKSHDLWERRIGVLATFHYLKQGSSEEILTIAKKLLTDDQDLIHKAVGWMLRELGKRVSEKELLKFLDVYAELMPRVMLRYAIERLPENTRKKYLKIKKKNEN